MEQTYLILKFSFYKLDNSIAKGFFQKMSLRLRNTKGVMLMRMLKKAFGSNECIKREYGYDVEFKGSYDKCLKTIDTYKKKIEPQLNKHCLYMDYQIMTTEEYLEFKSR